MHLAVRWLCIVVVRSFFRAVNIINPERIPLYGPVIFVGNHNNQFMDATVLSAVIPRRLYFLIAQKSLERGLIGKLAAAASCIAVKRPGDVRYRGIGKIVWDVGDVTVTGIQTRFKIDIRAEDKLELNEVLYTVKDIESDTKLTLHTAVTSTCGDMDNGIEFKIFPKIDQTVVYDQVSRHLKDGNTIGIFPEGGSHDRTTLLPLKAGVAIMALSATLEGAEDVMIVPLGLSYDSPSELQGLATAQIGYPILVTKEMAEEYQKSPKEAIARILHEVEEGMLSCLITAQDKTTMNYIRLCCSLYQPERLKLTTDKYYALHQLVSKLFWECADHRELLELCESLKVYEQKLEEQGIQDSEVWMLKQSTAGASVAFMEIGYYLIIDAALSLPIAPLWLPLRWVASVLAERHRAEALASSNVKLKGTDVVASYKVLVLLMIVPTMNLLYGLLFGICFLNSWRDTGLSILFCICVLPFFYYVSLRRFALLLSHTRRLRLILHVLVHRMNVWRDTERQLVSSRITMQLKVRRTLHQLGKLVSPTFLDELHQQMPNMVLESDSRRLIQKKAKWIPIYLDPPLSKNEEIL